MAHFFAPPGPVIGYDVDGKLAPNSVWRMQIPVGQSRDIMLWGGQGLEVRSADPDIVPDDGFGEKYARSDGNRRLVLKGARAGTATIETFMGSAPWCKLIVQVGVAPSNAVAPATDNAPEGMEIALSAVQLAAILDGASVEKVETQTNRLMGALIVLGGALELVGSAALIAAPEPTMVTKVAGGALAVHGSDTVAAGIRQILSNRPESTLTAQAATAAAISVGMDPDEAVKAGMVVDIAVPLIAGFAGALRIAAIRRGGISLAAEESAGGHTLAKHVGRTEPQLRLRLVEQPRIPAATTFNSIAEAEQAVSASLKANRIAIRNWAANARVGARFAVPDFEMNRIIGNGVVRQTNAMTQMTKVRVVLKKVQAADRIFFVLTSFPAP